MIGYKPRQFLHRVYFAVRQAAKVGEDRRGPAVGASGSVRRPATTQGEEGGFDAAADVGEDDAGAGGVAVGEADDAGDETLGSALDFEDGGVGGSDCVGG